MSDLRERIAEACRLADENIEHFITGGYDHYADAVLDALGLEQVGWVHDVALDGKVHGHAPGCDRVGCRPVYRLGGSHE